MKRVLIGTLSTLLIVLVILACQDKKNNGPNTVDTVLSEGIFTIIEGDSGKQQSLVKHPVIERMKQLKVPGASVAVVDDYEIQDLITFGKADDVDLVDSTTIFQAASVTKFLTAVMVHKFISEGLLDIDADINIYLKSWKIPENDYTEHNPITLRLLLSHQSGLPGTNFDFDKDKGVPTLIQILNGESPAINKPAIPIAKPGHKWAYSNIGYVVIQQLLEDVTGQSFQQIANKEIFKPLEMNSSTLDYPLPSKFTNGEATPHDEFGNAQPSQLELPAKAQGGLLTTPKDLAKLSTELMKAYNGESHFFSEETARRLLDPETELPFKFYDQTAYMGLGVLLIGEGENLAFIHNGYNSPGSVCIVIGFPAMGKGATIAVNSANGEQLYLEIIATLANEMGWPNGQFFK
ncbi:serine hydrolase domain-containing protein [Flagellimonas beolgyonensis]|uniref:serine hydrolase domain-containing protein n=1 Tax=Flagellimonas beolgyonensis TaxID=864064 RepID=UPI000F8DC09E|nr:serine hydrolase domain-containing protein [Allomuricauda beolgyonensis]